MNGERAAIARKQLERRLAPLRDVTFDVPPKGWVRALREALGMTARQLAARMGVSPSRIPVIERAEGAGSTTIRTMRQAAAAMDCAFVYAFVPIEPLDTMVRKRAERKVADDLAGLDHTMRLENQSLRASDLLAERRRLVEAMVTGSLRGLWDDDRASDA